MWPRITSVGDRLDVPERKHPQVLTDNVYNILVCKNMVTVLATFGERVVHIRAIHHLVV